MSELTPKQQRFVDEYIVDFNGTAAAKRAGYSEKSASAISIQLLRKTHVIEAVRKANEAAQGKLLITKERVVQMMMDLHRTSTVRIPVLTFEGSQVIDDEGKPVWKYLDAAAATKAVDMLARHTGAYEADNKQGADSEIVIKWGADGS